MLNGLKNDSQRALLSIKTDLISKKNCEEPPKKSNRKPTIADSIRDLKQKNQIEPVSQFLKAVAFSRLIKMSSGVFTLRCTIKRLLK